MKTRLDAAWQENCRLRTKADKLWRAAVTEVCGKGATCIVAGVMEFIYESQSQGQH
jgi:hypothetical protein